MVRSSRKLIYSIFMLLAVSACQKDENPDITIEEEPAIPLEILTGIEVSLDPHGVAPLTALIDFSTNIKVQTSIRVIGQNGQGTAVTYRFPEYETQFSLPVLGLYPDYENKVELQFKNEAGKLLMVDTVLIQTEAVINDMPQISIQTANRAAMKPGMNLVNYFGYYTSAFPQKPFIFDSYGAIRWFLDYRGHPILGDLFYDVGLIKLQNGNLAFGDKHSGAIYEVSMLGEILNSWSLQGYGFHHTILEKPNGNFLATVTDWSKPTVEDVILEIDRNNGNIVNTWDLNESLQNYRNPWGLNNTGEVEYDWFHANGLAYSPDDNAIIVSGRTQGVVKLSSENEVIWILAPHKNWEYSGNGTDLNDYLLQPLDDNEEPITNEQYLGGYTNHPDFEWNWFQHAPRLLPNGHLMVFDNGDFRNYSGAMPYSRAVEFEIDETNRTVQQVWDFGREKGAATYSRIVSSVDYFEEVNNVLFCPGAVDYQGDVYGKVIEVDRYTGTELFSASIHPPRSFGVIVFHSIKRISLYGD